MRVARIANVLLHARRDALYFFPHTGNRHNDGLPVVNPQTHLAFHIFSFLLSYGRRSILPRP
jgi:hypothetical protein